MLETHSITAPKAPGKIPPGWVVLGLLVIGWSVIGMGAWLIWSLVTA
jgi:hypothetical protein